MGRRGARTSFRRAPSVGTAPECHWFTHNAQTLVHHREPPAQDPSLSFILAYCSLAFFVGGDIARNEMASLVYIIHIKNHRFSVCDSNIWIGVDPRVVVAPFARRHLWCICAAISVGSQCVVARFGRRHLWGICGAVSVGSRCVVARFARGHLWCLCAAVSLGSQCVVARFAQKHLTGICAAVSVESQ